HVWTRVDLGGKLPSEIFREHILTCFIDDKFGMANYQAIGEDNIAYECDYPHSDCTWPQAPEELFKCVAGVPDSVINKVTHENIMRWYSWDPFPAIGGRDKLTVGALRKVAAEAGVDTTPVSYGGGNPTLGSKGPVTSGDVVKLFQGQSGDEAASGSPGKTQTSKRVGSAHPFLFATTGHRRGERRQTALRFWSRHPTYSQVGNWGGSLGWRAEVSSSAGDWHVLAPLLETSAL